MQRTNRPEQLEIAITAADLGKGVEAFGFGRPVFRAGRQCQKGEGQYAKPTHQSVSKNRGFGGNLRQPALRLFPCRQES